MNTKSDTLLCSIIVPVFNHWQLIDDLIGCVKDQTLGTANLELLLVDNGSDEIPADIELPSFARLLRCPVPGSYAARNQGIAEARGEWLAFTDADCRPASDWLENAMAFANRAEKNEMIIAGALVLFMPDREPNACELYDMVALLRQERYVQRGYGTTANLFIPATVIDRIGAFDGARFSGGDAEFCRRAGRHDVETRYCKTAIVRHPARDNFEALAAKFRRIKGGQITAGPYHRRLLYALRTLLPPLERWHAILTSDKLQTKGQRMAVFNIQCRLWLVEIAELIRLSFGNKPARS